MDEEDIEDFLRRKAQEVEEEGEKRKAWKIIPVKDEWTPMIKTMKKAKREAVRAGMLYATFSAEDDEGGQEENERLHEEMQKTNGYAEHCKRSFWSIVENSLPLAERWRDSRLSTEGERDEWTITIFEKAPCPSKKRR